MFILELIQFLGYIFIIISVIFTAVFVINFFKALQEIEKQRSPTKQDIKLVYAEHISNTIFVYDFQTNHFVAQGKNVEEALDKIQDLFPDKTIELVDIKNT